jgi:hypothetical protein
VTFPQCSMEICTRDHRSSQLRHKPIRRRERSAPLLSTSSIPLPLAVSPSTILRSSTLEQKCKANCQPVLELLPSPNPRLLYTLPVTPGRKARHNSRLDFSQWLRVNQSALSRRAPRLKPLSQNAKSQGLTTTRCRVAVADPHHLPARAHHASAPCVGGQGLVFWTFLIHASAHQHYSGKRSKRYPSATGFCFSFRGLLLCVTRRRAMAPIAFLRSGFRGLETRRRRAPNAFLCRRPRMSGGWNLSDTHKLRGSCWAFLVYRSAGIGKNLRRCIGWKR